MTITGVRGTVTVAQDHAMVWITGVIGTILVDMEKTGSHGTKGPGNTSARRTVSLA